MSSPVEERLVRVVPGRVSGPASERRPVPATGALSAWKPRLDLVAQVFQQLPAFRP
ncbi:hypothetical protein QF027_000122 [Streptomyces canus]|nr:hypothetical protein [Streptomyces canus]